MDDIRFSTLNLDDEEEVRLIAQIHQEQPIDWIEGYQIKDQAVEQTYKELITLPDDSVTNVIVARAGTGDLIGFHWIRVSSEGKQTSGRIHSLWVHEKYRRCGIARKLKELGEAWMREQGAVHVTTEVFYVNKKMIDLNIKLGFTPWQVEMTKDL